MKITNKINHIIIDANFLLMPIQFKLNIFEEIRHLIPGEIRYVILPEVINELKKKAERERGNKFKLEVSSSLSFLDMIKKKSPQLFIEIKYKINQKLPVDDIIIEVAKKLSKNDTSVYIATNDKGVKIKAQNSGIPTIFMRQGKFLAS